MNTTQELQGVIERIVYHNEANGYTVCIVHADNKQEITATGNFPQLHPGQLITLNGIWKTHPKFGKQFETHSYVTHHPHSSTGIKKYLASGLIKGIGPLYAQKLVDHFGTNVLEIIEKHPDRLREVSGIGTRRIEKIIHGWQSHREISHIMIFLQEHGVSTTYALKIYKTYGMRAREILLANPYQLADDVWGIGFAIADKIANSLGIDPHGVTRITAAIYHILSQAMQIGHIYLELNDLKQKVHDLLKLEKHHADRVKAAFHNLYDAQKIKVIEHEHHHYIATSQGYFTEKSVTEIIKRLKSTQSTITIPLDKVYTQLRTDTAIELHEDQQRAILTTIQEKVSVITGGPGTGKTTIVRSLLAFLDTYQIRYKLAAPTGRAAQRLAESTGRTAYTIHRLLEFDPQGGFTRNDTHALESDVVIIDEASMLDIFLAHALLKAVPYTAHIIFIGDIDQLPSVGAGNFLSDIIGSNVIPCVRLTQIFRQARNSMIVLNAHRVNNGEFPTMHHEGARRDFIIIKEDNPEFVLHHIESIFSRALPRAAISTTNTVILVPMHRGTVGTHMLNTHMQTLLNGKHAGGIKHAATAFKVNDRVMQMKNNYTKLVFNGDIGTVIKLNEEDRELTVSFGGREIIYEVQELDELSLAYAISIHKSQGSEFDAVIMPLFMEHFMLLQKNLLYTGITRAKKLCILIGQPKAIGIALGKNVSEQRCTFLKQLLIGDIVVK